MRSSRRIAGVTTVFSFAVAVFVVDLYTPAGIEVWVFYLPVVLSVPLFGDRRLIVAAAA